MSPPSELSSITTEEASDDGTEVEGIRLDSELLTEITLDETA